MTDRKGDIASHYEAECFSFANALSDLASAACRNGNVELVYELEATRRRILSSTRRVSMIAGADRMEG